MPSQKPVKLHPQQNSEPYKWYPGAPGGPKSDVSAYDLAVQFADQGMRPADAIRKAGLDPDRWAATERQAAADAKTDWPNQEAGELVSKLYDTAARAELRVLQTIHGGRAQDVLRLMAALRPDDYNIDLAAVRRDVIDHVLTVARSVLAQDDYLALAQALQQAQAKTSTKRAARS